MTAKRKTTDSAAPLTDPWFEDSQPVEVPAPTQRRERERRERTQMPKL